MRLGRHADHELLRLMAMGDAQAFDVFYTRHLPQLTGFFLRRVRNPEVAFDLVAETFASVVAAISTFDPARGSGAAWLFGIAANKLRESARRGRVEARARERLAMEPILLLDDDLERVEELSRGTDEGSLMELLKGLTDLERDAIWSRVVDERSYEDIALSLECSEAVVRQRVSRGLARMRERTGEGHDRI